MDRFHLLKVFVAVCDAGGFAGAARRLSISPPAVTRAINDLESLLGVRLLTRTTRVVRVTEAGQRYAEDGRRILAELAEADESVSGLHGQPRGKLTITAPALFGSLHVTPIVAEYLGRYPEVSADCWFLDRVVNMMDEGVDVAVRIGELPDSSMQALRVGQVRRVIVASPDYLAARGTPQAPADLAGHSTIVANSVTPMSEWRLLQDGQLRAVRVQPRLSTTSTDAAVRAAVLGFGLTRLLSYQVEEHLRSGRLQVLLAAHEPPPLPVHVVHREFIDLAVQRLRENAALQ
ncbi:LysR substrate-binding domain-containing protein [Aquabacterium sp.]|uniref:LysR substrate-binding domain-containing protein n=1 Tax=Aquabacterium sp. TaxID=1872578 RepID=UPI003783992D